MEINVDVFIASWDCRRSAQRNRRKTFRLSFENSEVQMCWGCLDCESPGTTGLVEDILTGDRVDYLTFFHSGTYSVAEKTAESCDHQPPPVNTHSFFRHQTTWNLINLQVKHDFAISVKEQNAFWWKWAYWECSLPSFYVERKFPQLSTHREKFYLDLLSIKSGSLSEKWITELLLKKFLAFLRFCVSFYGAHSKKPLRFEFESEQTMTSSVECLLLCFFSSTVRSALCFDHFKSGRREKRIVWRKSQFRTVKSAQRL